jgi:arginase family enzyme
MSHTTLVKQDNYSPKIIIAPFSFGAPRRGSESGPIRLLSNLKHYNEVQIIKPPKGLSSIHNTKLIREINCRIKFAVLNAIDKNQLPIIFHGDDSSIIGTGFALLERFGEKIGFLYFDAHPDLNTPSTSPSGCIWGMGLRVLCGEGYQELINISETRSYLKPEQLIFVGARAIDAGEKEFIDHNIITLISDIQINSNYEKLLKKVSNQFFSAGITSIYIHIDTDVFENGAGLDHVDGGINGNTLVSLVYGLKDIFQLRALSIGNYCYDNDHDGRIMNYLNKIIREIATQQKYYYSALSPKVTS